MKGHVVSISDGVYLELLEETRMQISGMEGERFVIDRYFNGCQCLFHRCH